MQELLRLGMKLTEAWVGFAVIMGLKLFTSAYNVLGAFEYVPPVEIEVLSPDPSGVCHAVIAILKLKPAGTGSDGDTNDTLCGAQANGEVLTICHVPIFTGVTLMFVPVALVTFILAAT